jgi:hypothetical protein
MSTTLDPTVPDKKIARNEILNRWLIRSDYLCADYQLQLSRSIRDTRLATDFLATVLSGLATILAQPAVTRPLAGSATIALGVGGDIQSDLFLQQAGDVVGTAIQAVRTRSRTELQKKFTADYADYTLEQGFVDVQRYDRETCNLNVGLNEIRASLNIIGPAVPQANDPIVPLPRPLAEGPGPSPESATSAATTPMATTIIPPTVQNTPGGGLVLTPGKVVTTPAAVPPISGGPAPPQTPMPPAPRPAPPPVLPPEPPCQPRAILTACPAGLAPEVLKSRRDDTSVVKNLRDVAKLFGLAQALGVATPVPTVRCMRRDILDKIEQVCTSDQREEMDRALSGLGLKR